MSKRTLWILVFVLLVIAAVAIAAAVHCHHRRHQVAAYVTQDLNESPSVRPGEVIHWFPEDGDTPPFTVTFAANQGKGPCSEAPHTWDPSNPDLKKAPECVVTSTGGDYNLEILSPQAKTPTPKAIDQGDPVPTQSGKGGSHCVGCLVKIVGSTQVSPLSGTGEQPTTVTSKTVTSAVKVPITCVVNQSGTSSTLIAGDPFATPPNQNQITASPGDTLSWYIDGNANSINWAVSFSDPKVCTPQNLDSTHTTKCAIDPSASGTYKFTLSANPPTSDCPTAAPVTGTLTVSSN